MTALRPLGPTAITTLDCRINHLRIECGRSGCESQLLAVLSWSIGSGSSFYSSFYPVYHSPGMEATS